MDDKIHRAALCQDCFAERKKLNVVRDDKVVYGGKCTDCGRESKVIVKCRYTLKGNEKRKRGWI